MCGMSHVRLARDGMDAGLYMYGGRSVHTTNSSSVDAFGPRSCQKFNFKLKELLNMC
jgi:hypothetical protein